MGIWYAVAVCCGFNKRVKMPTAKKLMRDTYKKMLAIVNNEAEVRDAGNA